MATPHFSLNLLVPIMVFFELQSQVLTGLVNRPTAGGGQPSNLVLALVIRDDDFELDREQQVVPPLQTGLRCRCSTYAQRVRKRWALPRSIPI
jgi:hypothetical protein